MAKKNRLDFPGGGWYHIANSGIPGWKRGMAGQIRTKGGGFRQAALGTGLWAAIIYGEVWRMDGRCWIVGAGDWCAEGWSPQAGDLVIAADGGQAPLSQLGAMADVVVGDFDSLREAPRGGEIVRLPAEKDDTDMVAALRLGLARGYRDFRLYGAAGGRIDHTIANLQALGFLARQGARGVLVEARYKLVALWNGEMRFRAKSRGMLSVFAQCGEARGVDLEGLKYEQHGFTLREDYPMGVSNEFTGILARVAVREGMLLVAWEHTAFAEGI